MSNRDWERELADIDRRLSAIPEAPAATPATGTPAARGAPTPVAPLAPAPTPGGRSLAPPPAGRSLGTPAPGGRRSWRAQLTLLLWLALGIGAVAGLIYWPYAARCGAALGYYLALVGALGLVGLFTSISAWRHRAAVVHLLGLGMIVGATVLGAREVLPKTGYAVATLAHPATWSCTP